MIMNRLTALRLGCYVKTTGGHWIKITKIRRLTRIIDGELLTDPNVGFVSHWPMESILECWEVIIDEDQEG